MLLAVKQFQFVWILLSGSSVRSEVTSKSMMFITFRLALLSLRGPSGHFLVPLPAGQIVTTLGLRRHPRGSLAFGLLNYYRLLMV